MYSVLYPFLFHLHIKPYRTRTGALIMYSVLYPFLFHLHIKPYRTRTGALIMYSVLYPFLFHLHIKPYRTRTGALIMYSVPLSFPFPFTYQTVPYLYWCTYNVFGSVCFRFTFPQRKHRVISQLSKFYQHCLGIRLYPICVMVVLISRSSLLRLAGLVQGLVPCQQTTLMKHYYLSILFFIFIETIALN